MKERIKRRTVELAEIISVDESKINRLFENIDTVYKSPETDKVLAASMIDHTILSFNAKKSDVEKVCVEAADNNFKAICINPVWIKSAVQKRKELGGRFSDCHSCRFSTWCIKSYFKIRGNKAGC